MCNNVGDTIYSQLGAGRFVVMTGAKNFLKDDNKLMFNIGKNKTSCNKVIITLTPMDTYTVEFWRVTRSSAKLQKAYNDIYNDQLQSLFTDYTGLYTSL